jgi:1-acyl-sn-glycerol-3-phosphate acyltransferase
VEQGQGTGGTGAGAVPPNGPEPDVGITDADDAADDGGGGGAVERVRQARERLGDLGEKAELSRKAREAAEAAREKLAGAGQAVRSRRIDMPWARSLPARLTRALVQRGLLIPALSFLTPVNVMGRRNLRKLKGPAVLVANHQSHFDAPVILSAVGGRVRRRLVIAAAADYFYRSNMVGAAASVALGTVPFHRTGGLSRSSLDLLKDLVGQGWSVLIFPSGSRGDASVTGFKRGFAFIAIDQQVPVVPIYLHGLDEVMPKGARIPLPGGVAVGVGTPIPPGDDYDDLVKRSEAAMLDLQAAVQRWQAA